MNILFVYVGIFVGIILIALLLKVIKGAIKIFFFVSFSLLILLVVSGYFIIQDAKDFQENFPTAEKTFILLNGDEVIAGFRIAELNSEGVTYLDNAELTRMSIDYKNDNLENSLGNSYKIFLFDYDSFNETLENGVAYQGFEVDKATADRIFTEDNAMQALAESYGTNIGTVQNEFANDEEVRGAFFAIMIFAEFIREPQYLVDNLKNGEVQVYPETALIIAVKLIPDSVFEGITNKVNENEIEILGEG